MDRKQLNKILLQDLKVNWKKPEDVEIFLVRVRNISILLISALALLQLMELGNFFPFICIALVVAMLCELIRIWRHRKKFAIFSLILVIYCAALMIIMFFVD